MPIGIIFGGICLVSALLILVTALGCLLYGQGRIRKKLSLAMMLLIVPLTIRFGSSLILAGLEMGWRGWVKASLTLVAAIAFIWLLHLTVKAVRELLDARHFVVALTSICVPFAVLGLLAYGGLNFVFGTWSDHVSEWEGQKVVVEYTGIFHANFYRYENAFVHGEKVYGWSD